MTFLNLVFTLNHQKYLLFNYLKLELAGATNWSFQVVDTQS